MIKLKYEAKKGDRLSKRYIWVQVDGLWWHGKLKIWSVDPIPGSCSARPCNSVKAFKRMLRKNPQIVGKSVLCNRYKGHDVYG